MNLSEIAEEVRKQAVQIPESQSGLVKAGQAVLEAVSKLERDATTAQETVRQQLSRIPLAVQQVQLSLQQGQSKVLERLSASQTELARLQTIVETAEADLAEATTTVRKEADDLAKALPDTQSRIHALIEDQRNQLDKDRQAEQAAQESLQTALAQVKQTVDRLTVQAADTLTYESTQVKDFGDTLTSSYPELRKALEALAGGSTSSFTAYRDQLINTRDTVIKAQTAVLQNQTLSALDEQVRNPAQQGIDQMVHALTETTKRLGAQAENEVAPLAKEAQDLFVLLTGPPQLRVLVKASKQVLQKVGKLNVLGPLANTL